MELRGLGRAGVRVSALALGTMTFGREADSAEARAIVDRYLDAGGNFVDTADVYAKGASEEILGEALGPRRDRVVLATKGRMPMSADPNDRGAGRRHLLRACEASLRRLRTDWIDLYQVHWPDDDVPLEETLATLDDLVTSGKVRYVGLSNYVASDIQRSIDRCDRHGWAPVVSLQPQYSLICRDIEHEILSLCRTNDIAVVAYSPLGGGMLTGKYGHERNAEGRLARKDGANGPQFTEHDLGVIACVDQVATAIGRTASQVALNWVVHRPGVTAAILGARNAAQLEDNLGADGWALDEVHAGRLEKVSRKPLPYPQSAFAMIKQIVEPPARPKEPR